MEDFAQASLAARAWELPLMLLSQVEQGLFGAFVALPHGRQAMPRCSLVLHRQFAGKDYDRKLIQTSVH